jgi:hypothetical protein
LINYYTIWRDFGCNKFIKKKVSLGGLELPLLAPEASALSTELQGHTITDFTTLLAGRTIPNRNSKPQGRFGDQKWYLYRDASLAALALHDSSGRNWNTRKSNPEYSLPVRVLGEM